MPLYLYDCDECGRVELRHRAGVTQQEHTCGGSLRRLWTAPSIKFKGSGFYSVDSAGK